MPKDENSLTVIGLNTHRSYKPDVAGLASRKVAAARERAGLSRPQFAEALSPLLGWTPSVDLVETWETRVAPPGQVIIACEVIASDEVSGNKSDAIEVAVQEVEADQARLLAGPSSQSVDSLWQEVTGLARAANRSPAEMFTASSHLRRNALKLAEDARNPGTIVDLYSIAGQGTALMASTAFDLNRWDASDALARAAISYASLVGNSSLHAWTLGLAALVANWRNEPDAALLHFQRGIEIAPRGAPRVRLRYIAARTYALLDDHSSVASVLAQARRDQDDAEKHYDELSEAIGGEFSFGVGRAEACAASAWLDMGSGAEAKASAQRALDELLVLPAARQSVSQVTGARIDLASSYLISGELDAAGEMIRNVTTSSSSLGNVSLAGRLARVRRTLSSGRWAKDPAARRLRDTVQNWSDE
jgi:hypothetical protein